MTGTIHKFLQLDHLNSQIIYYIVGRLFRRQGVFNTTACASFSDAMCVFNTLARNYITKPMTQTKPGSLLRNHAAQIYIIDTRIDANRPTAAVCGKAWRRVVSSTREIDAGTKKPVYITKKIQSNLSIAYIKGASSNYILTPRRQTERLLRCIICAFDVFMGFCCDLTDASFAEDEECILSIEEVLSELCARVFRVPRTFF